MQNTMKDGLYMITEYNGGLHSFMIWDGVMTFCSAAMDHPINDKEEMVKQGVWICD